MTIPTPPWNYRKVGPAHSAFDREGSILTSLRINEAEARLIAAAPDLLAALEKAERELNRATQRDPQVSIALVAARAAIARAKGEGP